MAQQNDKKDTSKIDEKFRAKDDYSLLCSTKIFSTKSKKSTQTTMTRTNMHRKNRNSREKHYELQKTFHINALRLSTLEFMLSSLLALTRHFGLKLFQSAIVITLLSLFLSTKVTYAITQNSHSTLATITERMPSTTTTMSPVQSKVVSSSVPKYSQPLLITEDNDSDSDSFRPIIPKDIVSLQSISQNVFTKTGQYRVFEPIESDLRATLIRKQTDYNALNSAEMLRSFNKESESRRKTYLQEKQEVPNKETSIRQHERKTQTRQTDNKMKITQNTSATTFQGNENHFEHKLNNTQLPLEGIIKGQQQDFSSSKQLTSSAFHTLNANKTSLVTPTDSLATEINSLEHLLADYVNNFLNNGLYQPKPELLIALQHNVTEMKQTYDKKINKYVPDLEKSRPVRQALKSKSDGELSMNIPRTLESGRLLFFAGLKKVMWPIYMGLQILKSLMFALLLPTLIGSFGKLLGKGISSGSAPLFIRPMDEPQDLDFRDNNFNFEDDSNKFSLMDDAAAGGNGNVKDAAYAYNQAEASQTHNQYAYNAAGINQEALSRYGMNERQQLMQDSYLSALQSLGAASFKNSIGLSGSSSGGVGGGLAGLAAPMRQKPAAPANMNNFQQFQKVPTSSLLLSNYDPFYSPLLSRLDSVFAQLKLNSDDEACREKLICLMYANPAKYAPYSNLVSAQLSRELNELRKPTSDNPDILRFFKYMRAAKDGQDGVDCEKSFDKCKEFKDFENPAMVSTYHDINKLVQARKLS